MRHAIIQNTLILLFPELLNILRARLKITKNNQDENNIIIISIFRSFEMDLNEYIERSLEEFDKLDLLKNVKIDKFDINYRIAALESKKEQVRIIASTVLFQIPRSCAVFLLFHPSNMFKFKPTCYLRACVQQQVDIIVNELRNRVRFVKISNIAFKQHLSHLPHSHLLYTKSLSRHLLNFSTPPKQQHFFLLWTDVTVHTHVIKTDNHRLSRKFT